MRKLVGVLVVLATLLIAPAAQAQGVTQPVTYDGVHAFNQGVYMAARYNCEFLDAQSPCVAPDDPGGRFVRDMAKLHQIGMHDAIVDFTPEGAGARLRPLRWMLDKAQTQGVFLIAALPYSLNDTADGQTKITNAVNNIKGHPNQYGYYIADEPGQHPGENFNTEKAKVVAMAQRIRALDANPSHRIFTAHFGCDRNLVNTFQKPYAQTPIIDQAMVDCYPVVPGNDAADGSGIDQIVFAAWDQMSLNSINAGRQVPRAIGQFFSWHQDDLARAVDWPTFGQVQRQRNCAVIAATAGIFYFNLDWAWDGPGWPNVPVGKAGRGEIYVDTVLKAATQSPMDFNGSQRCVP